MSHDFSVVSYFKREEVKRNFKSFAIFLTIAIAFCILDDKVFASTSLQGVQDKVELVIKYVKYIFGIAGFFAICAAVLLGFQGRPTWTLALAIGVGCIIVFNADKIMETLGWSKNGLYFF